MFNLKMKPHLYLNFLPNRLNMIFERELDEWDMQRNGVWRIPFRLWWIFTRSEQIYSRFVLLKYSTFPILLYWWNYMQICTGIYVVETGEISTTSYVKQCNYIYIFICTSNSNLLETVMWKCIPVVKANRTISLHPSCR